MPSDRSALIDEFESLPIGSIYGPDAVAAIVGGSDFEHGFSGEGGSSWTFMNGDVPSICTIAGALVDMLPESDLDFYTRCRADSVTAFADIAARSRYVEIRRALARDSHRGLTPLPSPHDQKLGWLEACRPRITVMNPWSVQGSFDMTCEVQPFDRIALIRRRSGLDLNSDVELEVEVALPEYARFCATVELTLPDFFDNDQGAVDAMHVTIAIGPTVHTVELITKLHHVAFNRIEVAFESATGHQMVPDDPFDN